MPSVTLNRPEDRAMVKRFLASSTTRIITCTVARLYVAYPDPNHWTFTGLMGAVGLVQTSDSAFYLRLVDLMHGSGILWEQELCASLDYQAERPFFHTFQSDNDYLAGLSFADENEAKVFCNKVQGRHSLKPFRLAMAGAHGGLPQRTNSGIKKKKIDKTRIGQPSDFRHLSHIGWDPDAGFETQNIDPAWLSLFEELNRFGVSKQQINENAAFISNFVKARGGPSAVALTGPGSRAIADRKDGCGPLDLSRIDTPSGGAYSPRLPPTLRPLSPIPIAPTPLLSAGPPASPTHANPFQGYLPGPLAQMLASFTGYTSRPTSPTPTSPHLSTTRSFPNSVPPVEQVPHASKHPPLSSASPEPPGLQIVSGEQEEMNHEGHTNSFILQQQRQQEQLPPPSPTTALPAPILALPPPPPPPPPPPQPRPPPLVPLNATRLEPKQGFGDDPPRFAEEQQHGNLNQSIETMAPPPIDPSYGAQNNDDDVLPGIVAASSSSPVPPAPPQPPKGMSPLQAMPPRAMSPPSIPLAPPFKHPIQRHATSAAIPVPHSPPPATSAQASLLESIRDSGGLEGLRKIGRLRSPPPRAATSPSLQPHVASPDRGDLVAALVAALHSRQHRMVYSDDDDDESGSGKGRDVSDDGWDDDEDEDG
ncbi:hypothetical protein BGZ73_004185 [Actinomortierella ambigua]|nr:hypothetical protein BGZ73_004185 [Actinomortierella ambigua]